MTKLPRPPVSHSDISDHADEQTGAALLAQIRDWMTQSFGERCPDFCVTCICCQAWRAYDGLLAVVEEVCDEEDSNA